MLFVLVLLFLVDSVHGIHSLRSRVGVGVLDSSSSLTRERETLTLNVIPDVSMNDFHSGALANGRDRGYWNRMRLWTLTQNAPPIANENSDTTVGRVTTVVIGTATYTKDHYGRVIGATAPVGAAGGNVIGSVATKWLDAMYYYSQSPLADRPAAIWTAGHIIAKQIGGSNTQPLNFFPHHVSSNGAGPYWRMENIVRGLQDLLNGDPTAAGMNCVVIVKITFTYPPNFNRGTENDLATYVPSGGRYAATTTQACGNRLSTLGLPPNNDPRHPFMAAGQSKWLTNGNLVEDPPASGTWVYRADVQWVNTVTPQPFDRTTYPLLFV